MKAIIASILTAVIAVVSIAAPAGATNTMGDGFYLSANGATTIDSYSKMGIKNGKFYIEGEMVMCSKTNVVMGGQMTTGDARVNRPVPTLPSAAVSCSANEVINTPPANSTVTINGICGDPAEIAKIKAANANLIINSTGPCPTTPTDKPVPPTTVIVYVNAPTPDAKPASATTTNSDNNGTVSDPKGGAAVTELPQTGISPVAPIVATGLAALTYAGGMAIRAFRARA